MKTFDVPPRSLAFLSLSLSLSLSPSLSFHFRHKQNGFLVAPARRAPPLLALAVRGAQHRNGCRPGALRVRPGASGRAGGAHGRENSGETMVRAEKNARPSRNLPSFLDPDLHEESLDSREESSATRRKPPSDVPRGSWSSQYPAHETTLEKPKKNKKNRPCAPLATKSAHRSRPLKRLSSTSTRLVG